METTGRIFTVGEINRYIKRMFSSDLLLHNLTVEGEVSNLKYHTSGHIYFSLKDEGGTLSAVMFAGQRRGLGFRMKDGDHVLVKGMVDVYERDGKYQLYAREITLKGAGLLYERFLQLKEELLEMGMFDAAYKKPIPGMIRTLGIVTAPTGAAVQDIRNVSLRRNPGLQLILYPAQVQGEGAAESIVKGIRTLDAYGVDVMIVGRGGGSIEDLWAFNEEIVARAIFACQTPVISAVGHETDFTIADFVADLRAPTPSAAAELAVEDSSALIRSLSGQKGRLLQAMQRKLLHLSDRLASYETKLHYLDPRSRLRDHQLHLDDLSEQIRRGMQMKLMQSRHRLEVLERRIAGQSPFLKLDQGYAYVSTSDGKALKSIRQVTKKDELLIYVTDGILKTIVSETRETDSVFGSPTAGTAQSSSADIE